jgi:hypothetical protein
MNYSIRKATQIALRADTNCTNFHESVCRSRRRFELVRISAIRALLLASELKVQNKEQRLVEKRYVLN